MSSTKEKISGCLNITFSTNFARLTWATVLHLGGIVLTVINLAVTTATPKEALSWARFDLQETSQRDARWNMGLLKFQSCGTTVTAGYDAGCHYHDIGEILNPEGNLLEAGRGVITACTFAMLFALFSVIILWLWIAGKADKLKFPRILLQISNFLSLTLYIVAVSTFYKLSYNNMQFLYTVVGANQQHPRSLMPGYAIAILIVVIVMSFFAWGFTFWRVCRPNKNEPVREKKPKAQKTKDVDSEVATSTSALDTAKAQQVAEQSVEGQADEPGSYENPSSPSNGGAYGGSYGGGAYGNAGGAYSSNDGGSYGNSSSAYGNSGGAYSQKESAYGY